MKTIKEAKEYYNNKGINNVETLACKTPSGNYVYCHMINGNSKQHSHFYNPETKEDGKCDNAGAFNYQQRLRKVQNLGAVELNKKYPIRVLVGYLRGAEVAGEWERMQAGGTMEKLPTVNSFNQI